MQTGAGQADGGFGAFQDGGHPFGRDTHAGHPADAHLDVGQVCSALVKLLPEVRPQAPELRFHLLPVVLPQQDGVVQRGTAQKLVEPELTNRFFFFVHDGEGYS